MSDTEEKSINISLIPKSIEKATENIITPVSNQAGKTIGDIWYLVFGGISEAAEKKRLKITSEIEKYKAELQKSVDSIPEEQRQEPKLQIVGPALEKSKYCVEEEELRSMFINLISHSIDKRFSDRIHPSFPDIIEHMSPQDAKTLTYFRGQSILPIVEYRLKNSAEKGHNVIQTNVLFSEQSYGDEIKTIATSLSALEHLGLIKIRYDEYLTAPNIYEPFSNNAYYEGLKAIYTGKKPSSQILCQKGLVKLTLLGELFISVCLS